MEEGIEKTDICKEMSYISPIPIFLEKLIRSQGVKTGSCVFGGLREKSDVDILFLLDRDDDRQELLLDWYYNAQIDSEFLRYVAGSYRDEDSEFLSCYVRCRFTKRPVNLLLFDEEKYFYKWADATRVMKLAIKDIRMKTAIKDKKNRVHLFEAIKYIFER